MVFLKVNPEFLNLKRNIYIGGVSIKEYFSKLIMNLILPRNRN